MQVPSFDELVQSGSGKKSKKTRKLPLDEEKSQPQTDGEIPVMDTKVLEGDALKLSSLSLC